MTKFNFNQCYLSAINSINAVVLIIDMDGKIIIANQNACASLGYQLEELKHLTILALDSEDKRIMQALTEHDEEKFVIHGCNLKQKGGHLIPHDLHVGKITQSDESLYFIVANNLSYHCDLENKLKKLIAYEEHLRYLSNMLSMADGEQMDDLLTIIAGSTRLLIDIDFAGIFVCDSHGKVLSKAMSTDDKLDKSLTLSNLLEELPWTCEQLSESSTIILSSLDQLPSCAQKDLNFFKAYQLASLCCSQLYFSNALRGVMILGSMNKKQWSDKTVNLIEMSVDMMSNAFYRFKTTEGYKRTQQELKNTLYKTVMAFGFTMEERDPYTAGHQWRVAKLAKALANKLSLERELIDDIYLGGMIHDIGKIYITAEILTTPKQLTDEEFALIKKHPEMGYKIVKDIPFPEELKRVILEHHERLDGSGYPKGLKDSEISIGARIVAVADVYESMSSHRPYRPRLSDEVVLKEFSDNIGTKYDKDVVNALFELLEEGYQLEELEGALFKQSKD